MTDFIQAVSITDVSSSGLLALVVLLLLMGRLVTRTQLNDLKEDRDHWRHALEVSEEARHESSVHVGKLSDAVRTTQHLVDALGDVTNVRDRP